MIKTLLVIVSLVVTILSYSQGIEFENGTFADVLEKAKLTGKPIFIDVYTSWCGPCKKMSSEVFPLAEVGKVYNSNFICYTVDAEKGEGVTIAKQYEVNSYPNYLFINADKSLIMRTVGSMEAEKFIALAQTAKEELKTPKPLAEWDKEYVQKKTDTAFLLAYIQKRARLGMKNAALFDEYLAQLPNDRRTSNEIVEIYDQECNNLQLTSLAYKNLQTNAFIFYSKLSMNFDIIVAATVKNSFRVAVKTKNEQLLQQVIEALENLPKTPFSNQKELYYMNYYKATNETEKYITHATLYAETALMTVSPDSIAKLDEANFHQFEQRKDSTLSQIKDSVKLENMAFYMKYAQRYAYSETLNRIARYFFEKVVDTSELENALLWSKRAVDIYKNCIHIDTYANLLYKLGRKDEAIANETEAIDFAKKYKHKPKPYEEILQKMNAGEKTWK